MPYLFAHGTLRQGGRNNNLISSAILLGRAETEQDYALYTIKDKPVVTKLPKTKIKGEVYAVSDDALTLVSFPRPGVRTGPAVDRRPHFCEGHIRHENITDGFVVSVLILQVQAVQWCKRLLPSSLFNNSRRDGTGRGTVRDPAGRGF